ncbi:hypothetical protein WMF28_13540 [Sorangium sp. So ce590]|uniref:hypothetical protein n=1 Tax=Sorangium sp. So ce590 TaxID=3133317 RepID=UPI003F609BFE
MLSRIAQEIRGSAPPAPPEDAARRSRIAPLDEDGAESEARGEEEEEEADRAARQGRGRR